MVDPELTAMTAGRPGRLSTEPGNQHDSPPTALAHVKQHHSTSPTGNFDNVASSDRIAMMNANRVSSRSTTNLSLSPTMTTNTFSANHNNFILNDKGALMSRSASLKEVISSSNSSHNNNNNVNNSVNVNSTATSFNNNTNNSAPHSTIANVSSVGPSIPFVRSRTGPQQQSQQSHYAQSTQPQQHLQQPQPPQPQYQSQRERRDSHSVVSQASTGPGDAWQWQENNDPDDQEQALFEQRLCEDIYGVAVRKINHNGKSNLRYVKCGLYDASEFEYYGTSGQFSHSLQNSSSRSVSSRSRNGFPRFLGGDRSVDRVPNGNNAIDPLRNGTNHNLAAGADNYDAHRNLIPGKKIKALTWGKKKDVKIPIERFVMVRKGKTTDRTKRNTCPASRILSLITDDPHHMSLDIEAPTRLDRDKFARAFSRFLNVPLEGENDMRSVRSDVTPQSVRDPRHTSSQPLTHGFMHDSTANSSVPDIAMTTTNSYTTNASSRKHAPLPVVTTGSGSDFGVAGSGSSKVPAKTTAAAMRSFKWRQGGGISGVSQDVNPISIDQSATNNHPFDVPDPQISSLPSSSNNETSMGFQQNGIGTGGNNTNRTPSSNNLLQRQQSKEKILEIATLHAVGTPASGAATGTSVPVHTPGGDDALSIVSSITGAGFDQDLVEELHLALEKMRRELEESRAEASRAVKVAEQAIQSAENSSSKDWNSTVTHKAAEAAAAAQKKSAEALAKARLAEERLDAERKNALIWKKQVETAEEQTGHWQTRAAAAEVQRHAVAEALECERKKNAQLLALTAKNGENNGVDGRKGTDYQLDPFDPFDSFRDLPSSSIDASDKAEIDRLRSKLAMESARRRKLLDELQDLRGAVRVYCRPRAPTDPTSSTIAVASNEVLMLQRNGSSSSPRLGNSSVASSGSLPPLSFEFDGILSPEMDQHDVYAEFEAICASVVEGYKVCIMTYGQSNAGKTYTMLGNVEYKKSTVAIVDHGIHLRSMQQLFSILEHRRDRYQDIVTMTLIEVHEERLIDLLAMTEYGEAHGKVEGSRKSSSRRADGADESNANASQQANSTTSKSKLEIKTNRDGETVVHGVLTVDVSSFADVYRVWTESLARRSKRLTEQDVDPRVYELGSHVIATLKVTSRNLVSGIATSGRMQFVDFASSDIVVKRSISRKSASPAPASMSDIVSSDDWKFANKSLNTVSDVVRARSQYQRTVPYRNSTITHLIGDSLEADTKVVMIACVSPDEKDLQNTACTLRFAHELRKVVVGKATRHTTSTTIAASPSTAT